MITRIPNCGYRAVPPESSSSSLEANTGLGCGVIGGVIGLAAITGGVLYKRGQNTEVAAHNYETPKTKSAEALLPITKGTNALLFANNKSTHWNPNLYSTSNDTYEEIKDVKNTESTYQEVVDYQTSSTHSGLIYKEPDDYQTSSVLIYKEPDPIDIYDEVIISSQLETGFDNEQIAEDVEAGYITTTFYITDIGY